jgi:hypothetical protein
LTPVAFRLASIPLDPELAARLARAHAGCTERRERAKRAAARKAAIKRHHSPVNVLGGYRFATGAPPISLSPIESPTSSWAIPSRWKPTGDGADEPPIPDFLRRNVPAASRPAAKEKAEPMPGPDLLQVA